MRRYFRSVPGLVIASCVALACTACSGGSDPAGSASAGSRSSSASSATSYDEAISTPQTDTVYPQVGDPGLDALHYGLDLTWDGTALAAKEVLDFRATVDADHVTLDFSGALAASDASLDGSPVTLSQSNGNLVVTASVAKGSRHQLKLSYSGTASPVKDPSSRDDAEPLGLTRTSDGGLWTMQEPYGASTWFAVDDQPADKAFYDVTVHAPARMVGISNGVMTKRTDTASGTTTVWHSADPMASYLTTLAVGAYTEATATSSSGVPLAYWVPTADQSPLTDLKKVPELLTWLEARLGPYPFDSLSFVIVPAESAMETQSTITLGSDSSDREEETLVHEIAHQWYGDEVTPADWRDLWMNEGMATWLQLEWQDQAWNRNSGDSLMDLAVTEPEDRKSDGPPGNYKADHFADNVVYSAPAMMWAKVEKKVGATTFARLVRDWPSARAGTSVTREDYLSWLSEQSGTDLTPLMTAWLTDRRTPRG